VKLVVDTNTLLSGSLWDGPSAQLLDAVGRGQAVLVMSPDLLAEFAEVVSRPKFAPRILARHTTPADLVEKLLLEITLISPPPMALPTDLRDPKDLPVLACAVAADTDAVVSGDKDLLTLREFQGIPIINAREALQKLGLKNE
jgi:putative PIN family toxin of toxin-antitoxin system